MATQPQFIATPRASGAAVTVANTNLDGSGTLATIFTAGANGSRIDSVKVKSSEKTTYGATTADTVRLFLYDGTNTRLLTEVNFASVTTSTSVPLPETTLALGIVIPTGWVLKAATYAGVACHVTACGGDF